MQLIDNILDSMLIKSYNGMKMFHNETVYRYLSK